MLPNRVPRDASEALSQLESRLTRLELKGRGFVVPNSSNGTLTFAQDDQPVDSPTSLIPSGSIWIDTNNSNVIYTYLNGTWQLALDPSIEQIRDEAANAIVNAQDAAAYTDNMVTLFYTATQPPIGAVGDLWVHPTSGILYRTDGATWVSQGSSTLAATIGRTPNAGALADTKVITWWQFHEPVAQGIGDLWVDTSQPDKPLYRWTNFDWHRVLMWNTPLLTQIDSKVSTFHQDTPPVATAPGDIWYDTSDNNAAYRADILGAFTVAPGQWVQIPVGATGIVDGQVNNDKLALGAVTADVLESNLVLSSAITTGSLDVNPTSPTFGQLIGQRIELSQLGLRLVDDSGHDIVAFPTDIDQPAVFYGQVRASGMRAIGDLSIESSGNEVSENATLSLGSSIGPPRQGPTVVNTYGTVRLDSSTPATGALGTFAFNATQMTAFGYDWAFGGGWMAAQYRTTGSRIWRFKPDGSIRTLSDGITPMIFEATNWLVTGVTSRVGTSSPDYIGRLFGVWYIIGRLGSALTRQRNTIRVNNTATYPTLGWDNATSTYMVAETLASTDQVDVRRFQMSATDDGFPTTVTRVQLAAGTGRNGSLNSIAYGNFDFGSPRYVYSASGSYQNAWVTSSTGVARDTENIPAPVSDIAGFGWDGTNFWTVASSGTMYKHSGWTWTDSNTKLFVGATYYDSDPLGTGTHETVLGATSGITRVKRASVKVTMPLVPDSGLPDDPNRWRLYAALSTGATPSASSFHLQAEGVGTSSSSPGVVTLNSLNAAGAAPPATSSFGSANPGVLVSTAVDAKGALIRLAGDGSGRIGPYSWSVSDVAGSSDLGWVDLTPASGFVISGSARCRRIGKMVDVTIQSINNNAAQNVGANGNISPDLVFATVPVGYRPPVTVRGGGQYSTSATVYVNTVGQVAVSACDATGTAYTNAAGTGISAHFMYFVD